MYSFPQLAFLCIEIETGPLIAPGGLDHWLQARTTQCDLRGGMQNWSEATFAHCSEPGTAVPGDPLYKLEKPAGRDNLPARTLTV